MQSYDAVDLPSENNEINNLQSIEQNQKEDPIIESIEVALTKPQKVHKKRNSKDLLNLSSETRILGPAGDQKENNTISEYNLLQVYSDEFPISNSRKMIKDSVTLKNKLVQGKSHK